jgi:hypothetical protein
MLWASLCIVAAALVGHVALWTVVFNRLHATGLARGTIDVLEKVIALVVVAVPVAVVWQRAMAATAMLPWPPASLGDAMVLAYIGVCVIAVVRVSVAWFARRAASQGPTPLLANHTRTVDLAKGMTEPPVTGFKARVLSRVPGNQILQLDLNDKELVVPGLPAGLDGLSIAHISDLHFTGGIARSVFDAVIDRACEMDADLVALTGDVVDHTHCIEWIVPTLSRLHGRHGSFFVLGNHDKRVRDVAEVRRSLREAGYTDLGGRWHSIEVRGYRIVLAGNELPWFGPPPARTADPDAAETSPRSADDSREAVDSDDARSAFRILLSHSPDQIDWAREHRFDLMLAGHTHGGQIRFPLVGAVVCPSRWGVKYASGVYHEPPTVLHVTRGISGLHPIRLNCRPELTRLILRVGRAARVAGR